MKCEECGIEITNYWGYLSDFFPNTFPPRDRSNDHVLYGIQVGVDRFYYFCSEQQRNMWVGKHPEYKMILGDTLDEADTA